MKLLKYKFFAPPILAAIAFISLTQPASAAVAPLFNFNSPLPWTPGAAFSTYQEWAADPIDHIDGIPNVGFNDVGAGLTSPTLTAFAPGFLAGSGGYYSFSGNYNVVAAISNPTAGLPAGAGTYVIVQTFASINPDGEGRAGTVQDLKITDALGNAIAGIEHLQSDVYGFQTNFPSSFGLVDVQATVDAYWIPGFTGNFAAALTEIIHSSVMGFRVDSIITTPGAGGSVPFSAVPEPASLAVLSCSMAMLMMRRRRPGR